VKQSHSSVSFGIGVGGGSYGGGGAFGMGVSTSVPLGGSTTTERKAQIRARFYNRETGEPAWEKVYTKTLGGDLDWLVKSLASDSVKAIKKKKLIATK
jgi:hypothetical protein